MLNQIYKKWLLNLLNEIIKLDLFAIKIGLKIEKIIGQK